MSGREDIYLSPIVTGELLYGVEKSAQAQRNLPRYLKFLSTINLVTVDLETAKLYGKVKMGLEQKGRRIPENDIWIAASALQHGMTLVTDDQRFSYVEGLSVENWLSL